MRLSALRKAAEQGIRRPSCAGLSARCRRGAQPKCGPGRPDGYALGAGQSVAELGEHVVELELRRVAEEYRKNSDDFESLWRDEVVFDVVIARTANGVNARIQAGTSKRLVGRNVSVPTARLIQLRTIRRVLKCLNVTVSAAVARSSGCSANLSGSACRFVERSDRPSALSSARRSRVRAASASGGDFRVTRSMSTISINSFACAS